MLRSRLGLVGALVIVGAAGCASRQPSADELGAHDAAAAAAATNPSTPLDLREFEVVDSEGGYRGVFLKLSRLPTAVTHSSVNDPGRIVIDIQGPTGTESAEEIIPAGDALITHMRVSRQLGSLRVVLDLDTADVPEYAVFPMADWIMVRVKPSRQERPWAHRAS